MKTASSSREWDRKLFNNFEFSYCFLLLFLLREFFWISNLLFRALAASNTISRTLTTTGRHRSESSEKTEELGAYLTPREWWWLWDNGMGKNYFRYVDIFSRSIPEQRQFMVMRIEQLWCENLSSALFLLWFHLKVTETRGLGEGKSKRCKFVALLPGRENTLRRRRHVVGVSWENDC